MATLVEADVIELKVTLKPVVDDAGTAYDWVFVECWTVDAAGTRIRAYAAEVEQAAIPPNKKTQVRELLQLAENWVKNQLDIP